MSKDIRVIREDCCNIWNKLKDKTKMIDYLIESKQQIADLEAKLAEKETDLSLARNEINTLKHNLNISQEHDKVMCEQYFEKCKKTNQDKISFCIGKLIDVRSFVSDATEIKEPDYTKVCNYIDNQIKQIKEKLNDN